MLFSPDLGWRGWRKDKSWHQAEAEKPNVCVSCVSCVCVSLCLPHTHTHTRCSSVVHCTFMNSIKSVSSTLRWLPAQALFFNFPFVQYWHSCRFLLLPHEHMKTHVCVFVSVLNTRLRDVVVFKTKIKSCAFHGSCPNKWVLHEWPALYSRPVPRPTSDQWSQM